MNKRFLRLAAAGVLAIGFAGASACARADRPPSWAVGIFRGYNRKYNLDVELNIDSRGKATRVTWKRDSRDGRDYYLNRGRNYRQRGDSADGRWDRDELVFGKDRYRVDRTREGIYTIKTSDRDDTTDLRRTDSGIRDDRYRDDRYRYERYGDDRYRDERYRDDRYRDDRGTRGDVPSWAVGTFRGRSGKYDLDVELRISESGAVDRYIWNNGSKADSEHGRWEDGEIVFGKDHYRVIRSRDGIETEKRGDDTDVTNLRRR